MYFFMSRTTTSDLETGLDTEKKSHSFVKKDLGEETDAPVTHKKTKTAKAARDDRSDHIETQLAHIYENGDGSMPDMHHFERKKGRTVTAVITLFVACLFLGGVVWAGFFFLQPSGGFREQDVIMTISGEEQATIGASATYRIRYRNDQGVPLSNAQLQVRYPEGFVYETSEPAPTTDQHDTWSLGSLDADESGFVDISGRMYGDVDTEQSFRVFLNYRPANFSSDFQKVASLKTTLHASAYALKVEGPEDAVAGAETAFTIVLDPTPLADNVSSTPLIVVVDPGSMFTKKSSEPVSDKYEPYRWTIANPEKGASITVRGAFAGDGTTEKVPIAVTLVGKKPGAARGDEYAFATAQYAVALKQADTSVMLVMNGANNTLSVTPGERLQSSIVVRNAGKTALNKVRVRAVFDTPSYNKKSLFDWSKIEDIADGTIVGEQVDAETRRGTISWDTAQVAGLKQIKPGEDVTIDFSLPLKTTDQEDLTAYPTRDLTVSVEIQFEQNGKTELAAGNRLVLTLNSDVALDVRDTVTNDSAGEKHALTWLVSNTFHALKDLKFEADLYGDISLDQSQISAPAGTATFDAKQKRLTWTVPEMPTSVDVLALQVPVILKTKNPSQSQLVSKVRGKATDTVTGKDILLSGNEIAL